MAVIKSPHILFFDEQMKCFYPFKTEHALFFPRALLGAPFGPVQHPRTWREQGNLSAAAQHQGPITFKVSIGSSDLSSTLGAAGC